MRINSIQTFTSYGSDGGSTRVRVFDWLNHLGLEADSFTYLGRATNSLSTLLKEPFRIPGAEARLRTQLRGLENKTVLLSRQASPFSNGHTEQTLLKRAARGVYDFDDAIMQTLPTVRERIWSKREVWRRASTAADVVIAGNDYLAEQASQINSNVVVIPSCVEPSSYLKKVVYSIDSPLAVWLGSPATEKYLRGIEESLLALHKSHGLRVLVISAGKASLGNLDRMVDRREWGPATYQEELVKADFGIMPLDDTLWSRGKCAYKLLQYGVVGLPMIGSAVGANEAVLRMSDGIAVTTSSEWHDAMEALITEGEGRRLMRGRTGRAAIEQSFSFSSWSDGWRKAMGLSPG